MSTVMVDPDAFRAFEVAGWTKPGKAESYHSTWGQITSRVIDPLLDAAGVGSASRVLDLATGPGYAAAKAAERGARVVGVDVSQQMVDLAALLHPRIEFHQADAEGLPFDANSFDAVVGNFIILHVARPEKVAAELVRVVGPGGRAALTVWDVPENARFIGVMLDAVHAVGAAPPPDLPVGPPIFQFSSDDAFRQLLSEAGLVQVTVSRLAFNHRFSGPTELWDCLVTGTVRLGAVVLSQPAETQAAIRADFDRRVATYQVEGGLSLPVSIKLASGSKRAVVRRT